MAWSTSEFLCCLTSQCYLMGGGGGSPASGLLLSSIRLQVLNDLSAVAWAHQAVPSCDQNPPSLTFPISCSVCNTFKYQKLFGQIVFDPLPLEVLIEILMNEILKNERPGVASRQSNLGFLERSWGKSSSGAGVKFFGVLCVC